jgi:hypothetical protein
MELFEKLDAARLGFSPKMAAIVGAVIGHDYGVRDRKGGKLGHLSITSDGYVTAQSTASDGGGAFIGSAEEVESNLGLLVSEAALSAEEKAEYDRLYAAHVTDWRFQHESKS